MPSQIQMETKDVASRPHELQVLVDNSFASVDPTLVNSWNNARMGKNVWGAPGKRCHEVASSAFIVHSVGEPSTGISMTVQLSTLFYTVGIRRVRGNDETKDDPPPRVDLHTPVDYTDMPPLEDEDALSLD